MRFTLQGSESQKQSHSFTATPGARSRTNENDDGDDDGRRVDGIENTGQRGRGSHPDAETNETITSRGVKNEITDGKPRLSHGSRE